MRASSELKARPDEQRDTVVVCLSKELAVDAWLEDYNKRHPVNQIEIIKLRTDQKFSGITCQKLYIVIY
jgi:hypothetical protein